MVTTKCDDYVQEILSNLPNSVYWKDTRGVYLGANIHAARMIGLESISDIIGKTDYDLFSKEEADKFKENDAIVIATGKEICIEEEVISCCGEKLLQLSTKKPIINRDGKIVGVMGITIDITHIKKIENALIAKTSLLEEALSHCKRFLNNMSHELRTPLHLINTITEELYKNVNSFSREEFKSFLRTLRQNNKRLVDLVGNLLELAKNEQNKSHYVFEKKNIVPIVQQVISKFSTIAPISFNTPSDDMSITIDEIKLAEAIRHIIDNAVKYGQGNLVIIDIEATQKDLIIKVKGKSIGIPEHERQKVFEPFFQCSNNRSKAGGTGLGLSICRGIIQAHGGYIRITENESEGTSINCTIPYTHEKNYLVCR